MAWITMLGFVELEMLSTGRLRLIGTGCAAYDEPEPTKGFYHGTPCSNSGQPFLVNGHGIARLCPHHANTITGTKRLEPIDEKDLLVWEIMGR